MIIPFRGRPERRYSDELPQSVEAVAQWEDGKIVVWVAPGLADEDGAVEAAESALLAQRRDERRHRLLLPLAAGYAAVRAHAGAASASAVTLLAAGTVGPGRIAAFRPGGTWRPARPRRQGGRAAAACPAGAAGAEGHG